MFLTAASCRVLYTIFIALDACLHLKRRLVSSELKDPDLGSGWAYMVETEPYRDYLHGVTSQKEVGISTFSTSPSPTVIPADEYMQRAGCVRLRKHQVLLRLQHHGR